VHTGLSARDFQSANMRRWPGWGNTPVSGRSQARWFKSRGRSQRPVNRLSTSGGNYLRPGGHSPVLSRLRSTQINPPASSSHPGGREPLPRAAMWHRSSRPRTRKSRVLSLTCRSPRRRPHSPPPERSQAGVRSVPPMKLLLVPDIYQIHQSGLDRFNNTKDLGELRIAEVLHAIEAGSSIRTPAGTARTARSGAGAGRGGEHAVWTGLVAPRVPLG
jgi:hypothetical protein